MTLFRLAEVGKLATPKVDEKYETGQFFLHRVFGYRGVILFPWRAKTYDRNTYAANEENTTSASETDESTTSTNSADTTTTTEETAATNDTDAKNAKQKTKEAKKIETDTTKNDGKKEVTVDVQTYYQVLIDSRDCPHVVVFNPLLYLVIFTDYFHLFYFRELKRKRSHFWPRKSQIEIYMQCPVLIMYHMRILFRIQCFAVIENRYVMIYLINFLSILANMMCPLKHRKCSTHGKRKIINFWN